jgi:cbb3-type cytochrome oxidase cytochrome c subunit
MDTLIIGGQKYQVPSSDEDVIKKAKELLATVKQVATNIDTDEEYDTVVQILDEIDALVS